MKTIITADACINHNGNFNSLIELLTMVERVQNFTGERILFKMQKRSPEVYSNKPYDSWLLNAVVPYCQHKAALEFNMAQYREFDAIAKKKSVEWYASVFDFKALEEIVGNFNLNYWKIASPVTADCTELAVEIARQNGVKFVSTGMSSEMELDFTVNEILKVASENDIILMHCRSMYPCPDNLVSLRSMDWLRKRYGLRVGYSSHDVGVPISVAAVAMGAVAIEKHITASRANKGPDQALSLELRGLETLVAHIKGIELAMGFEEKIYLPQEKEVRDKVKIKEYRITNVLSV